MFDVAVIGLGLIGGAALRHLSAREMSAVGIGPAEPEDWSSHRGPFASHYDSGRITRRLDARYEWAVLASRSIDHYGPLEAASSIAFHHPVGLRFVRRDEEGIAHQRDVVGRLGLPVTIGTSGEPGVDAGGYTVPPGWTVLSEPGPAGLIDPRRMLEAQLTVATNQGAQVRRTVAGTIDRITGGYRIGCTKGEQVEAARVLISAGAYASELTPQPLAASVAPEAVVLAQVATADVDRLRGLPSLIYLLDHPRVDDVYVVPPTTYPDGRVYVKMGGSRAGVERLETAEAMRTWMMGSDADEQLADMASILRSLLPDVAFEGFEMKPCLITDTVHGLPFVDEVDEGLFVAAGGNGHAGKSADAIGALAADLVATGTWNDGELDRAAFRAVFGDYRPNEGSRHGN